MIFKCQREMVKVNMIVWQEGPAGRQRDFVGKEGSVYRTLWKKQTWGRSGVNHLVGAAVLRDLVLEQESLELQPGARTLAGPRGTWALCRGRSIPRSRRERQAGAGTLPSDLGHSRGAGGTFLGLFVAVFLHCKKMNPSVACWTQRRVHLCASVGFQSLWRFLSSAETFVLLGMLQERGPRVPKWRVSGSPAPNLCGC